MGADRFHKSAVQIGASPRATIFLARAARAYALLRERGYVIPDDIKAIAPEVLRHRIILNFEGEAEAVDVDRLITQIIEAAENMSATEKEVFLR